MKRGFIVLAVCVLAGFGYFTMSKWAIHHKTVTFVDPLRSDRNVTVEREDHLLVKEGRSKKILKGGERVEVTGPLVVDLMDGMESVQHHKGDRFHTLADGSDTLRIYKGDRTVTVSHGSKSATGSGRLGGTAGGGSWKGGYCAGVWEAERRSS